MQLGLGVLRLSPQDFWRASPREIAAAFAAEPAAIDRTSLEHLIARFPDGS